MAGTLVHLSCELQSCPSHGHTVTLLGLLAGGRDPTPAPSAIAGVVSRVGSLERSVEFHEQTILELERQVSVVDSLGTKVEEMQQLLAQLEHLSGEFEGTSLAVAELGEKLEMRVRDLGALTIFVEVNNKATAKLHDDLMKRVLHVEQEVESRVTNLEQWSHDVAESVNVGVNAVEGRVKHLKHGW